MYDSIRVVGLRISTEINATLIRLSKNQGDPLLKKRLIHLVLHLCNNSMLLKQDDNHLRMNQNHLAYSKAKFEDVIEAAGLKAVFETAIQYQLQQL